MVVDKIVYRQRTELEERKSQVGPEVTPLFGIQERRSQQRRLGHGPREGRQHGGAGPWEAMEERVSRKGQV